MELIKKGFSQQEISILFGVTKQAIFGVLKRAKRKEVRNSQRSKFITSRLGDNK